MHLLVSNDDGIESQGINALEAVIQEMGTTWVVAPESEQSAQSHSLTMHKPLRAEYRTPQRVALSGTPADCVYFAVNHAMPERPRLVVSGINHGSNLGTDVFYSGTVAAAMEARFHGLPSLAVSLHRAPGETVLHWKTAQHVVRRVVGDLLGQPAVPRLLLNLNIPNVPLSELRGLKAAVLGERRYHPLVSLRTDPRGREYFWIGGAHAEFADIPHSDGPAIEQGWATITPIHNDLTLHSFMDELRRWTDA